jgi:hypothetical protein
MLHRHDLYRQIADAALTARRMLCGLIAGCAVVLSSVSVNAQSDEMLVDAGIVGSILDEKTPFDIITLKKEAGGRSVRVNPIDFPDRKVPSAPKETDRLRVTFPVFPDRTYEVAWRDIEAVYLYEQLILQFANKLLDKKRFGEAFEHLNFLIQSFPQTPGLAVLRRDFLYRSAIEMAGMRRLPHALAVLEEFQRAFPEDKDKDKIRNAISNVSSQIVDSFFSAGDLASAKALVVRLEKDYQKNPLPVVEKWKGKFGELAKEIQSRAIQARDAGDFLGARQEAAKMLEIDPQIEGGKQLLNDLIRAFPIIRVGVFQKSVIPDTSSLADWPAFRTGPLISRPLFEFRNTGPEGGQYRFLLGSFQHSDDRTELDLIVQSPGKDGVPDSLEISQAILNRALVGHSSYVPGWAAILDTVSVFGPERLKLKFRQPHVLPQAFLQWQLPTRSNSSSSLSLYKKKSEDEKMIRYEWGDTKPPSDFQPREIHEVLYSDPQKAIGDLVRGEIEMIDRLYPADVRRLRNARNVATEEYALPMVHMLIPRTQNLYLDTPEFRRALLYAINRDGILNGEILGGNSTNVSRVISGPFPSGASDSDPIAYAYNTNIENVAYDPRLAKILILLVQAKLRAITEKRQQELPPIPRLKLGVPNYESARVAGEAIVQAWKLIGVPAELILLDRIPSLDEESPADLVYVSAAVWEPATDAERLFGQGGPAESSNQFIVQELRKLRAARNWRDVRQGCQELHALVAAHLPVLPLWQVGETFAYRTDVVGIAKRPIGLYQDVQKWRLQAK